MDYFTATDWGRRGGCGVWEILGIEVSSENVTCHIAALQMFLAGDRLACRSLIIHLLGCHLDVSKSKASEATQQLPFHFQQRL
jgi:hypothetical protein